MTCFRHVGCLPPLMLALLAAAPASAQGRGDRKGPTLEDVYQKGTDASLSTVRVLIHGLKPGRAVALGARAIQKGWGWLRKYAEVKPTFLGFGVDLKAALDDLLSPLHDK